MPPKIDPINLLLTYTPPPTTTVHVISKEQPIRSYSDTTLNRLPLQVSPLTPVCNCYTNNEQQHQQHNSNNNKKRRKKNVSFSCIIQVREIEHKNDPIVQTNKHNIWYSKLEYKSIRKDCEKTLIELYDNDDGIDEDNQCTRGLEHFADEGKIVKRCIMFNAIHAVLQEQYIQRNMGINDVFHLSKIYIEKSYPSQIDSYYQALYDYKEVKHMQLLERHILNMISELAFV